MGYSVAEAAKAIGKSKATVFRAISSGRISAARDEATGAFIVEPVELHRVFPAASHEAPHDTANGTMRNGGLHTRVAELEARIAEKDDRLADAHDQIDDLRCRLDAEAEERRTAQAKLTAVLTDQRAASSVSGLGPRRSWWPWPRR